MTTPTPLADRIRAFRDPAGSSVFALAERVAWADAVAALERELSTEQGSHRIACERIVALERELADARALYVETEERRANDSTRLEAELADQREAMRCGGGGADGRAAPALLAEKKP